VGALHTDELKIAAAWSDAEPLQEELKGFLRKVSGVTSIEPFPLV
jgi:hypothetical protein